MATQKYTMKQYDLEPGFEVQLLDGTTPIDLTSAMNVTFLMKNRKGLKAVGAMSIPDQSIPTNVGVVRYDWSAGDTDTAGQYNVEVQVTWPNQRPQTFPASQYMLIDIQKDLSPGREATAVLVLNGGGGGEVQGLNPDTVWTS